MEKLFYSIGEAAEIIGESVSLVRFWTNSCPQLLKPRRNAKGNRQYDAGEKASVSKSVKALDSLKAIRAQLMEIKNSI